MLNYTSSTASKLSHRYPENYPKKIIKGEGAYIFDEKGVKYLDFLCSLGAISLGYKYSAVDEAVCKTIKDHGTIFSLSHPLEWTLSDILCELIPSAQMVRYFHNGKDPNEVAIRLARHITGREIVLSNSYHGASDVFMAITEVDTGTPKCLKKTIIEFEYNNEAELKKLFDKNKVAAVIMEPSTTAPPKDDYLEFIRDICTKNKALLIFDEVVTFPRMPKMSAQAFYDVIPDLSCVGKGAANGFPWSALVGKEKYMKHLRDGEVFASTTFGGCLVGVSAAIATLKEFQEKNVDLELNELGHEFQRGIKENKIFEIYGPANSRLFFKFKNEKDRWKLYQETVKQGLFFNYPILFNYSMSSEDIKKAGEIINGIVDRFDEINFEGKMPSMVFKRYRK